MKRILLVLEDYNELMYIETILKKVGFDVMGVQKSKSMRDVCLSFNPSILIVSETVKETKGLDIISECKSNHSHILSMIILNQNTKVKMQLGADYFLNRPIQPLQMIKVLAEWSELNEDRILEKIEKMGLFKEISAEERAKIIKGSFNRATELKFLKQTPEQAEQRSKRFQEALKNIPDPKSLKFEKKQVSQEVKEFRERERDPEIVSIDAERKAFVDALYVNKRKKAG